MKIAIQNLTKFIALILVLTFVSSCGDDGDKSSNSSNEEGSNTNEVAGDIANADADSPVTCLWSAVSIREEPNAKGKWITTIYLGEEASYLGESAVDSTGKKPVDYIKIRLTDGKEGWTRATFMAINAKSAVLTNLSKLYKRPDILAASKDEFEKFQYVVVLEEKDDWVRVKGVDKAKNWFREGWIKKDKITEDKIDVTVAVLAARAMGQKDKDKKVEALNEIVFNTDLSSSQFISKVKSLIESINMPSGDDSSTSDDYNNEDI